jgi:hypothetical protein
LSILSIFCFSVFDLTVMSDRMFLGRANLAPHHFGMPIEINMLAGGRSAPVCEDDDGDR